MKIILLEDVKGKGKKDDVIDVSDGYGNNYLLKNKLGAKLTKIKDSLEDKNIKFKVKVGKEDRVFGNISTKQISEEIKKLGFNIDKKCIKVENAIDTLGVHKVLIELHKRVKFYINIVLEK